MQLKAATERRYEDNIARYVPDLIGSDEGKRKSAVAVLFVLYPNEAKHILYRASNSAETITAKNSLEQATQKAEVLDKNIGKWLIVIGSDRFLDQNGALLRQRTKNLSKYKN